VIPLNNAGLFGVDDLGVDLLPAQPGTLVLQDLLLEGWRKVRQVLVGRCPCNCVTSSPSLPTRSMIKSLGFGVVVAKILVLLPSRTPNMI
jgi:hypothetical protein